MAEIIRIIGGDARGRKLSFPAKTTVRPTLDRIRETLFNWLMFEISGSVCLDLFAGSGALGLEALSRGAAKVIFVEQNPQLCRALTANIALLGYQARAEVFQAESHAWLSEYSKNGGANQLNLVFLDPPFDSIETEVLADICQIVAKKLLISNGLCYLEQPKNRPLTVIDAQLWQQYKHKQSGAVQYGLWLVQSD
jgi:16S rRNA (guanine966-N2)-methyltransferase